jgi:predicted kinase
MFLRVRASQLQLLNLSAQLFTERIESGKVCEGHGDLRPEHVCMLEPPVVFDCVEFSLPLRAADVISELAFLAMELDFLGVPNLARALIDEYRERTGDTVPSRLAYFYKCYRACVRAKVQLLRANQQSESEALRSRTRACRYLQLASAYSVEFYRPKLFVMVGAAGTGKSTIADALADALGLEILRTDAIRHELAGRREPNAPVGQGIYSDSFTYWTYETIFDRAELLLRDSVSVVLDGTFRGGSHRARAVELAQRCGADVYFLYCRCPADLARARIAGRVAHREGISDARPEMHELQQSEIESTWNGVQPRVIELHTARPISELIAHTIKSLSETPH